MHYAATPHRTERSSNNPTRLQEMSQVYNLRVALSGFQRYDIYGLCVRTKRCNDAVFLAEHRSGTGISGIMIWGTCPNGPH
jgi:hypothetical protein